MTFEWFGSSNSGPRAPHDCDLEVEIGDQHSFILSKKPLLKHSGWILRQLSRNKACSGTRARLVFNRFPGGFSAFEMCAVFCYTDGKYRITPSNLAILRVAAEALEMTDVYAAGNLIAQTDELLDGIDTWEWEELLAGLTGCTSVVHQAAELRIVHRLAVAVAGIISMSMSTPMSPVSENSVCGNSRRLSFGTCSSTESWWFSDLSKLSIHLIPMVVEALYSSKVDQKYLARFLLYYLRCNLTLLGHGWLLARQEHVKDAEAGITDNGLRAQRRVLETVVNLLSRLDVAPSCKSLFAMYMMATGVESSKECRRRIEKMIGLQLHHATLDNLLVSSVSSSSKSVYDVEFVHRLIWYFLKGQNTSESQCSVELVKVGKLMDKYLAQVAPDPHLHVHKFLQIAKSIPKRSRFRDDELYAAVDTYLMAHPFLKATDVEHVCQLVNYERLSFDACAHISQNPRFPAPLAVRALIAQKELLKETMTRGASAGKTCSREEAKDEAEEVSSCGSKASKQTEVQEVMKGADPQAYHRLAAENEELKRDLRTTEVKLDKLYRFVRGGVRSKVVDPVRTKWMFC